MDYDTLMSIASQKQRSKDKITINRYNANLPPVKREVKDVARSDAVKRLIQEKENAKQLKEKAREEAKEREEKKKGQFRIPKKKEEEKKEVDTEKLINSLFEDDDDDDKAPTANGLDSSRLSPGVEDAPKSTKSSHSSSSSSSRSKHESSSSQDKEKSSKDGSKSSSLHSSKSSREKKSHSSSSSRHSSSKSSSSSSNSKPTSSTSSSSSHRKSKSSSSKSKSSSSSSSSKSTKSSSSSSSSTSTATTTPKPDPPKPASELPITLSKHHLKPVAERQVNLAQLTEKEKIMAKLQAIKERTRAAILKEQEAKGKRHRGEKMYKRSSKKDAKEDERVKSKEIVRDICSSEDEDIDNSIPNALDIMMSEHQSRLEKDKISRLAKQAWKRATRKDGDSDEEPSRKKRVKRDLKKSSSSSKHKLNGQKRKAHGLSSGASSDRKKLKGGDEVRKKPKLVRHSGHAAPPPPDFKAILAMAAQKVNEPIKPAAAIPKKKKEKEKRPMTQDEKERKQRVKSKEYQNWLKFGGKCPTSGKDYLSSDDEKDDVSKSKSRETPVGDGGQPRKDVGGRPVPVDNKKPNGAAASAVNGRSNGLPGSRGGAGGGKPGVSSSSVRWNDISVNENVLVCGPADDDGSDDGGGGRNNGQSSTSSSNPFDRIYKSVHKKKPAQMASKRRQLDDEMFDDDDEEYDSDLDGFIDDGDDGAADYSKHISKIFGYNKHGYNDEEDDLADMETNYATIEKEERRSAKLGRLEDLEDMRMEEEELKRKAMLKKKMRR